MRRLQLLILAQALEDILLYELGLPLVGSPDPDEAYEEALIYVSAYPTLLNRWKSKNKQAWLQEIRDAQSICTEAR